LISCNTGIEETVASGLISDVDESIVTSDIEESMAPDHNSKLSEKKTHSISRKKGS